MPSNAVTFTLDSDAIGALLVLAHPDRYALVRI